MAIKSSDINNLKKIIEKEIAEKERTGYEIIGYINGLLKGLAWIDMLLDKIDEK